MRLPVYADNHSTTQPDPRVVEAMIECLREEYGNPSSDHRHGLRAKELVDSARASLARLINCDPDEIIFTSGATESNNMAIRGVMTRFAAGHIIVSAIEHPAVLDVVDFLRSAGHRVTVVPVNQQGIVSVERLRDAIQEDTRLISIMAANNEIGTLQPLDEIGRFAREKGIIFHCDAAQAVGHIDIDVKRLHIDLLSISAHKFHGPKGVGALYIRKMIPRLRLNPILLGGGQERGLRSGTLNVPGIVGLGKAAEIAIVESSQHATRLTKLRDQIIGSIKTELPDIELNGHPTQRLPHNINLYIKGVDSRALIHACRDKVSISAGSACSTLKVEPSHVIRALGLGDDRATESVRIGLSRFTTDEEANFIASTIIEAVHKLRAMRKATSSVNCL